MVYFVRYRERDTAGTLKRDETHLFDSAKAAYEFFEKTQNDGLPQDRENCLELGDMTVSRASRRGFFE